jgi:hypothetical protein
MNPFFVNQRITVIENVNDPLSSEEDEVYEDEVEDEEDEDDSNGVLVGTPSEKAALPNLYRAESAKISAKSAKIMAPSSVHTLALPRLLFERRFLLCTRCCEGTSSTILGTIQPKRGTPAFAVCVLRPISKVLSLPLTCSTTFGCMRSAQRARCRNA